jgi:anti-sigma B factor antagonist
MTAIPGTAVDTVDLICDRCATVRPTAASALRDEEVVWPLIAAVGWSGSPFATGPHWCATCATAAPQEPATNRDAARTGVDLDWGVDVVPGVDATVILTVCGDLCSAGVDRLRETLTLVSASGRHVVLNLAGVDVMDPDGLSALVRAHQAARKHGAALCLVAASRFIRTALHTMRLEPLFPLFDDDEAALRWLSAHAPRKPCPASV